jgi:BirA family biotin operon repressor/biotin-[acetyl-CoA-carboxylase] ligase
MTGLPHVHHRVTDSTNQRARELAAAGAPHGTLVTADEQTAGRGRQGRTWTAAPGDALLLSVVLRDLDELIPFRAAVAVSDALPVDSMIKWPNDIWLEGRKVAGILVEGRPQEGWAVLGIGINVTTREFPAELVEIATSLALAGVDLSRWEMLDALLDALNSWLGAAPADVLDAWRQRDALLGAEVRWDGGSGRGAGVTDAGALRVETESGIVELDAGEVHLLRN